ncbi:SLC13 family permease [Kibdelosporangium persicum]|uniref:Sodium-dependent dicarboxylate transporter SdcS n=1 Tax=Kibdelosporangium persicum TaxID=2698649 RepID=A0ABX2FCG6_9PSEU|nr:SLC13 family permease [Kibdelosporangium persicum]NRN68913.1 Sodium-dependent dicarboxylate transporter SdcS [Kibdelosporangium persicum]
MAGTALLTLVIFAITVIAWMIGRLDDTFVGLLAALALVFVGVIERDDLFGALGGDTIWLLIAAFVLAQGLAATGLPEKVGALLISRARSVRQLAHLITAGLILTALAVPATSGRAALALPVFMALAEVLKERPAVVRALALLIPSVILLSAIATLIGAGAHLITTQLLTGLTGAGIGFGHWLLLGLPFAVISSHLCAEVVVLLMTRREDRRTPLPPVQLDKEPFTGAQKRVTVVLAVVVVLWCTGFLDPALVALVGAVVITSPRIGTIGMSKALSKVPWSLLLFMASTAVIGHALSSSGAAEWLGKAAFGGVTGDTIALLITVVVVSAAAHLVLQSRSARSAVLVPLVIPMAVATGMNPAALAFASTAAAGFCHTLPSSAKPVAMFAVAEDVPTYRKRDLVRLSCVLGPLIAALVVVFAMFVWPMLGLPMEVP